MTNEPNEKVTFSIPAYRMDEFKERVAKLSKKAVKLGLSPISFTVIAKNPVKYTTHPMTGHELLTPMIIVFHEVEMQGAEPKFAGWTFLARIDHEAAGNIINSIPGIELNPKYRETGNVCEHCKIDRYRKASYVVRHVDGTEKQVGSSCIKDFLGHGSPERIAAYCESLFSFVREVSDDEYRYGGHYNPVYDIIDALTTANAIIRKYGWVSATKAREIGEQSTAGMFFEYHSKGKAGEEMRREVTINESDAEFAKAAVDWIRTANDTGTDYMYNLTTICRLDIIEEKHIALVLSLLVTYRKAFEKRVERQANNAVSEWIGDVKKGRITLENVKVLGMTATTSYYGAMFVYRFLANGKDKITWFSSNEISGINAGDIVKITASIKAHDQYKGERQTIITRAKIVK